MTSRIETAVQCFSKGFNCAQAVFSTYAPLLGICEEEALRVSAGFGAGMGRLQEVCGAVTGAFMLIGCKYGMVEPSNTAAKEKTYALEKQFAQCFRGLNGSILCRELLHCDLNTPEGKQQYTDNNLAASVCTRCVRDAAALAEEMLFDLDR
jgi:C_GCAxxG_C_C family probable redox protein